MFDILYFEKNLQNGDYYRKRKDVEDSRSERKILREDKRFFIWGNVPFQNFEKLFHSNGFLFYTIFCEDSDFYSFGAHSFRFLIQSNIDNCWELPQMDYFCNYEKHCSKCHNNIARSFVGSTCDGTG